MLWGGTPPSSFIISVKAPRFIADPASTSSEHRAVPSYFIGPQNRAAHQSRQTVALPFARICSPRHEPAPKRRGSEPTLSCGRWRGRRRGSRGPQLGPSGPCRRSWPRLLAGRAPPPPPRGRRASGPATAARAKTLCPAPQSGRLLVWLSWL